MNTERFRLSDAFIEKYKTMPSPLSKSFNGLGEIVFMRTYSRMKEDGKNELWYETVRRVVEGTFNMQKNWIDEHGLGWSKIKGQKSAQEMYDRIFHMKFLPPGRGLWAMGSNITEEKKLYASLNNCSFTSTEHIKEELSAPFCFLMDMSMLGVGVGFDTRGAGKLEVKEPRKDKIKFEIPDTREGWVESVRLLIDSYFQGTNHVDFDYSKVRKEGEPIRGFGGISSGPKPLIDCHNSIRVVLDKNVDKPITLTTIVDIMNLLGKCVVSGNVRRSAEIVFGDADSDEYLDLKNYKKNPHRKDYGWTSNNSIFAKIGMDYTKAAERTKINGEPGYIWMENVRAFSRMNNGPDNKDHRAAGANPCCFVGSTLIAVADGRGSVTLENLSKDGVDVPVYSVNPETGIVEIKWARAPRKTREQADLVKVHFENGESVTCTPDHNFLLLNGKKCEAKDLQKGDSVPRFKKVVEKYQKDDKQSYWRVFNNINSDSRVVEHKLIASFSTPGKYETLYDSQKKMGWVNGGIVIHHKDYNGLNNSPSNLEIMTFLEHKQLHGRDFIGEKNPMFGKKHSENTKRKIGNKTLERCEDAIFKQKLSSSHTQQERINASKRMIRNKKKWDKKYYLEEASKTDLETVWINDRLYAKKYCETCGAELILEWRDRATCFCGVECFNKNPKQIAKRVVGQRIVFEEKQRNTLHKQIMVFKDLEQVHRRIPLKKEWEQKCKEEGISFRLREEERDKPLYNRFILTSFDDLKQRAAEYNHRVVKVELLTIKEDVYNLTVDNTHTYAIVTKKTETQMDGIFVMNCEQSLEDKELCCLVETFPFRHENLEDYLTTLKYAYLYAKTVTLGKTHWPETNRVMLRNRRIGCSMSGIAQFITHKGLNELKVWCEAGYAKLEYYDTIYSDWLAIPKSIKRTSIKPSGTVSLLAGATPGLHFPESRYYIRRIRIGKTSDLLEPLKKAGYKIEPCKGSEDTTVVVEVPVCVDEKIRTIKEVSMWEQLSLAAFMQKYWADNQVSCTVTFKKEEADQIPTALTFFQYQLKGISFLPLMEEKAYEQMPYEAIDEKTYHKTLENIKPVRFKDVEGEKAEVERFCSNDTCTLK